MLWLSSITGLGREGEGGGRTEKRIEVEESEASMAVGFIMCRRQL